MPLDYSAVRSMYDTLYGAGVTKKPMPEWAGEMNTLTHSNLYDQGLHDGWWTRTSHWLDQNVFEPVASVTTEPLGGAIGGIFGERGAEVGRSVGRSLPRGLLETAPLLIPGLGEVYGGALVGGLIGAHTYADTGSAKAAAIAGVTGAALPSVGRIGGNALARAFGVGEAVSGEVATETGAGLLGRDIGAAFSETLPTTAETAGRFSAARLAGSQAAQIGAQQISQYGIAKATGQDYDPLSPEFWSQQIPFTVFDTVHAVRTKLPSAAALKPLLKAATSNEVKPAPHIPAASTAEARATVEALIDRHAEIVQHPDTTGEQASESFKQLLSGVLEPEKVAEIKKNTENTVLSGDDVAVAGFARKTSSGWKVLVEDAQGGHIPANVGETVFINGAEPTFDEASGQHVFKVKAGQVKGGVQQPLNREDFVKQVDTTQPDLPVQAKPAEDPTKPVVPPDVQRTLEVLGTKPPEPEEVQAAVEATPEAPHPVAKLIRAVDEHEVAKTTEVAAREAIAKPLDKAEEIPQVLTTVEDVNAVLKPKLPEGEKPPEDVFKRLHGYDLGKSNPAGLRIAWREPDGKLIVGNLGLTSHGSLMGNTEAATPGFVDPNGNWLDRGQAREAQVQARNQLTIQAEVKSGASPTQAVEKVRLQTQTPVVDKALLDQALAAAEAKGIAKSVKQKAQTSWQKAQTEGTKLLETYNAVKDTNPTAANVLRLFEKYSSEGAHRSDISNLLAREVARLKDNPELLEAKFKSTVAGQDVKSRGAGIPNEAGMVNMSRDEAEATLEKSGLQDTHQVVGAGKGLFKVQEKVTNRDVSLDKEHVEGETLQNVLQPNEPPDVRAIVDSLHNYRPAESITGALLNLEAAAKKPVVFMNEAGFENALSATRAISQAKVVYKTILLKKPTDEPPSVGEINAALSDANVTKFKDEAEMTRIMKMVRDGSDAFGGMRSFTLGSDLPHDRELVKTIGILEPGGLQKTLEWYAKDPNTGVLGQIVQVLLRARDFSKVALTFDSKDSFVFQTKDGVHTINIPDLPGYTGDALHRWGPAVVHESLHYVGRELFDRTDPAAVAFHSDLEQIRQALRNSPEIPKRIRRLMTEADKWFEEFRNATDGATAGDLYVKRWIDKIGASDAKDWMGVFYGLHNVHELLAQSFSSKKMVDLLTKTTMPSDRNLTALSFFGRVWRKVFGTGEGTDSAFASLMQGFDNYLSRKTVTGYNAKAYLRDSLITDGVRPEALASRIQSIGQLFSTGDLQASITGFNRENANGLTPTTYDVGQVHPAVAVDLATGGPKEVYASTLNLLAHEVPLHDNLWYQLKQDVKMAMQLRNNIKKGLVPGELPTNIDENLRLAGNRVNAMKRALDKQALDISRIKDIMAFNPEGVEALQASQLQYSRLPAPPDPSGVQDVAQGLLGLRDLATVRTETAEARLHGKNTLGFLERAFALTQFTKQMHPAFKAVANDVRLQIAKAHERINAQLNLAYAYNVATGEVDPKLRASNDRVAANKTLERASSSIKLYFNEMEQAQKPWTYQDDVPRNALSRLRREDRKAITDEIDSNRARHTVLTEQVLPAAFTELNTKTTARIIASHEAGMLPEVAQEMAERVYAAVGTMQNPVQAVVGTEMIRKLSTEMSPDTLLTVLRHAQGSIEDVNKFIAFMRTRPNHVSEQRYGKDHLIMRGPDGQPFRADGKSKEDLVKIQTEKEQQGYKFVDYIQKSDESSPMGIRKDTLDAMRELDHQAYTRLSQALEGAPADIREAALSATQRVTQYEAATNAFKPTPGVTRRFVEGREYLNMIENSHEFYNRTNNWLRHKLTRASAELDFMHPELAGNRELLKYAKDHVENALSADNPLFKKITEAVYFSRLAFSLGNSLLEFTQNLTTGMQAIIGETGAVGDGYKFWGKAVKEIVSHTKNGKWSNPELHEFMTKAKAYGLVDVTSHSDIIDPDTDRVFRATGNQGPVGKTIGVAGQAARNWTVFFQRYNDRIGMIAGHEIAKSRGMTGDDAFNYAWDLKERGMFSGGKAQRSVGLWNIKTKPVPQMVSALQTYTVGWFSQMANHYKIGFKGGEGFTETQRQGNRKAFVYGLAAQAVLAGALGLPGMSQGLALVKQASGVDAKGWLRAHLADLFGEDQDNGGWMTNLALRGGLAGVSPIDPSNRAAISFPFVGIDPYKGFDIAQLLGAPGASVSDAVQGALSAVRGDWQGFQKLLPSVLKPTAQLIQGEGDVRDSTGSLLYKLSPAEKFLTAAGLPPSRIQAARDTSEAVRNINQQAVRSKQSDVDHLAEAYRKEGAPTAQQRVLSYLKDHPDQDAKQLVRAIAGRVEAQTIPVDYRRGLNVAADLTGLGTHVPATELLRRHTRTKVASDLGLPPSFDSFTGDLQAAEMDRLMDSDPYLPQGVARLRASERLRGPRRHTDLLTPAFQ